MTTRLDPDVVAALDGAVAAGLGANRGAIVAAAVKAWLAQHGEQAIEASYRRRYGEPDPVQNDLVVALSAFSVAACLAASER